MSVQQNQNNFPEKRHITLRVLQNCPLEQQMELLEIRNHPDVRASMHTEHEIGINEHLQWINRLKNEKRQIVWIVLDEKSKTIGAININVLDTANKKADWGLFLDKKARHCGLGSALEYYLINYVFDILMLDKLNCEVVETNKAVMKFYEKFGFAEEGFRKENVKKDGKRVGVFFLGLTRSDWQKSKNKIYQEHQSIIDQFVISFDMSQDNKHSIISQIENARAKNNLNWMALLRLSMEKYPGMAQPIIGEILRLDTEISELTKKLVSE